MGSQEPWIGSGGLVALVFDYRYLGVSGGEPRQLIDTRRQRVDLRHAVEFARSRPDVDATRIALWGTSLGGSHVILAAADRNGTIERISAPLLATLARDDEVVSTAFVKEKVAKAKYHEIREYPVTHFAMYHGALCDQVAADQLAFLQHHLTNS